MLSQKADGRPDPTEILEAAEEEEEEEEEEKIAQKVKQQEDPPTVLLAPCDRPIVTCSQRRGASMLVTQPANSAMGHLDHSDSPARKADREKDRGTVQQGAMRSVKFAVQLAQCDRPSTLCSQSRGASMHVTHPVRSASESMDHRTLPVAREGAEGVAHGKKEHKVATEGREASAVVKKKGTRLCGAARATKGRPAGSNPLGGQYVSSPVTSTSASAAQKWVQMGKEKQGTKRQHRLGQAYTRLKKTALIAAIVLGSFGLTVAGNGGVALEVRNVSKQKEYGREYGRGSRKRQQPSKEKKRQKTERGRRRKADMEPD